MQDWEYADDEFNKTLDPPYDHVATGDFDELLRQAVEEAVRTSTPEGWGWAVKPSE